MCSVVCVVGLLAVAVAAAASFSIMSHDKVAEAGDPPLQSLFSTSHIMPHASAISLLLLVLYAPIGCVLVILRFVLFFLIIPLLLLLPFRLPPIISRVIALPFGFHGTIVIGSDIYFMIKEYSVGFQQFYLFPVSIKHQHHLRNMKAPFIIAANHRYVLSLLSPFFFAQSK